MKWKHRTWAISIIFIAAASASVGGEISDKNLEAMIGVYSTQRIVELNDNETYAFQLRGGQRRVIRLISVEEHRNTVTDLMCRAEVHIEIDGRPLELVCMPYTMPTESAGMRVLADTTAGWGNIDNKVQLSLWDAEDPIVDIKRFSFPLQNYRLLSQGTQAYNESVHLGHTDGDPSGLKFYHDYGFDQAGYEGREEVVSATAGKVALFWPSREDLCSVVVRDESGFFWEYAHLSSVEPSIILDAPVAKGQKIGTLGRSGPSGNFSHLHLGSYLTKSDLDQDIRNRRLNLYPWLVAAYQAQHEKGLIAVARPHRLVLTGEKVRFDGSNSLVWGGGKIVERRWISHDGQKVEGGVAEKVFERPGAYVAEFWVKDDRGLEDVDFCQVKVYLKSKPEQGMPHLFMTYTPTENIRPGQAVSFRCWLQGNGGGAIRLDFGDGTIIDDYRPYDELKHAFKTPGVHVVTAYCEAEGKPISQKLKVIVEAKPENTEVPK